MNMKLKYYLIRKWSLVMALVMFFELMLPLGGYALTTGPSQPEVSGFQPVSATEMVDPFTGDFSYNIPLFELPGPNGGYPFNLSYQSGISMDQEASWVGLGWTLSPGAISRDMRGLPDEFAGDEVVTERDLRADWTVGVGVSGGIKLFGADPSETSPPDTSGTISLPSASAGVNIYYNSYRGFGYGVDFSINPFGGLPGTGVNLSLDSQAGVGFGADVEVGLPGTSKKLFKGFSLGGGYNSRQGLTNLTLGLGVKFKKATAYGSATATFPQIAYSPQTSMAMAGWGLSFSFKTGLSAFGLFGNLTFKGNYSHSTLADRSVTNKAFGYFHLGEGEEKDLLDFNREKDGAVRKTTPNLPSPSLTYDIFSVSGQGTGGSFRARRNDIGTVHDPKIFSFTGTAGFGFDVSGTATHTMAGVNLGASYASGGAWNAHNLFSNGNNHYTFGQTPGTSNYEKYYYQFAGESTQDPVTDLNYLHEGRPTRVKLEKIWSGLNFVSKGLDQMVEKSGAPAELPRQHFLSDPSREPRLGQIQEVSNILVGSPEALPEYKVQFFNGLGNTHQGAFTKYDLDRSASPAHHQAGYTVTQGDGSRYVYGLPVKNFTSVECQFSVDGEFNACGPTHAIDYTGNEIDYTVPGSENYYNRQRIPEYSHSWMLSSILGADYVDADDVPGPSDGDFGYWVKFNYVKMDGDDDRYQWRAPFFGANFNKGYYSMNTDDKGSYMWGEREVYYLSSAETKTHVAEFTLEERKDARGATEELQNADHPNPYKAQSYKLNQIALYSKAERILPNGTLDANALPIQVVHMDYDYSLCQNVLNNEHYNSNPNQTPHAESGKLTLKSLWFTSEASSRGALSPYEFDYHESDPLENPTYNGHSQNCWGGYRLSTSDYCKDMDVPYVDQYEAADVNGRHTLDKRAAVWNLKEIGLPSGGRIKVQYEADDYGYVQDKQAMQLLKVHHFWDANDPEMVYPNPPDYNPNVATDRMIFFDLIKPTNSLADLDSYFEGVDQLYVKIKMDMKKHGDVFKDYLTGYLKFDDYGFDGNSISGGLYTRAYVTLSIPDNKPDDPAVNDWQEYPPLGLAAWQFMRTNLPQIAVTPSTGDPVAVAVMPENENGIVEKARSLVSWVPELLQIFRGYYRHAFKEHWAQYADLDHSWIRLNHPTKTKVGGGCRVKQVTLQDNWKLQAPDGVEVVTGMVYDYTMEENGKTISSGVSAYEPLIGGEEIPQRKAKEFLVKAFLKSPEALFFEEPINENLMPAPVVGYRRVAIRSLATEQVVTGILSPDVPTTGEAVHEFYTAKDFPVLVDETPCEVKRYHLPMPIPFVGGFNYTNLTASQGYSIILNDMHGKPKKVSNYRQDARGKIISDKPVSWVEYIYQHTTINGSDGKKKMALNNTVKVIRFDADPADKSHALIDEAIIGQDHEVVVDARENNTGSSSGGLNLNLEFLGVPVPFPWPTLSNSKATVRTVVTNKIIERHGIMTGMVAYNEGSVVHTQHKLFDALTGRPLLSTVTNDYGDPVYQYQYPAWWAYKGMGAAYQNQGIGFSGTLSAVGGAGGYFLPDGFLNGNEEEFLIPGDEFIVITKEIILLPLPHTVYGTPQKAVYMGKNGTNHVFYSETPLNTTLESIFKNVRSGYRNQLMANAQEITALKDPTKDRDMLICWKDFESPGDIIDEVWADETSTTDTVASACVLNLIALMNEGLSGTVQLNQLPYNQWVFCQGVVSSGNLSIGTSGIVFFTSGSSCRYNFFDAQGNLINLTGVQSFSDPEYGGATPNLISSYNYEHYSVQIELANGTFITGYLYSFSNGSFNCPVLPYELIETHTTDWQSALVDETREHTLNDTLWLVDSILSASAQTYRDAWLQDYGDVRFATGDGEAQLTRLQNLPGWWSGERGVWRPWESYTYVDDRDQTAGMKLKEDGTFSDMPVYNFQGLIFGACNENWRKVNEVMGYSPYSYETENRDVINIYSGALYGYGGKLPVAVCANAKKGEIGFESFEEYEAGGTVTPFTTATGNLEFYNSYSSAQPPHFLQNEIDFGYSSLAVALRTMALSAPQDIQIDAKSNGSLFNPSVYFSGPSQVTTLIPGTSFGLNGEPYFHLKPVQQYWAGFTNDPDPVLPYSGDVNALTAAIFTAEKAHTGVQSLKVKETLEWPQNRLNLTPGTDYIVQAWVSRENTWIPFYQMEGANPDYLLGVKVHYYNAAGTLLSSSDLGVPGGRVIEGWQRIEMRFSPPVGTHKIALALQPGGGEQGRWMTAYFDDVRVQPMVSEMSCHVYDRQDFRLKASLDNFNYASLYRYDEQGNLFVVEKETVDGVRTLQESRMFLKE
jgi:hypothetical protein